MSGKRSKQERRERQRANLRRWRDHRGKWLEERYIVGDYKLISRVGFAEIVYVDPDTGDRGTIGQIEMDELSVMTGSISESVLYSHVSYLADTIRDHAVEYGIKVEGLTA